MKKDDFQQVKNQLIPLRLMAGYSVLALISGLAGFAFIATVNKVINVSVATGQLPRRNEYLIAFIVASLVFFISRRWLSGGVIRLSQEIYWGIRKDVIRLILQAPYRKLQQYKNEVYSTLTADVANITNASFMVITFFSSIILILSCLVYMVWLSPVLFGISLGVIGMGVLMYMVRSRKSTAQFKVVRELERHFNSIFNTILGGAKEININPRKGHDIYDGHLTDTIEKGKATNVRAFLLYLNSELISQVLFYGLITFILIYAGTLLQVPLGTVINFVFVLLYLMGPIVSVMTIMPAMDRAMISLRKMRELKTALEAAVTEMKPVRDNAGKYKHFQQLEFRNYAFSFGNEKFGVGPINMRLQRKEVIFIHGGNGAGKTTFINTMLQLYDLDKGEVYVDGQPVPAADADNIKSLFAPIFSDFYLFDEFYGMRNVDPEKVTRLLQLFELNEKVTMKDGKFSTTDLSTGQRKRLALISALLEDRPVLVLDEWAADQDPHFRRKFYREILPMIAREEDKTIIAITHDDTYYHLCDKLLKMEYGQLTEISKAQLNSVFN